MPKEGARRANQLAWKATAIGSDARGNPVHVGDTVDHVSKRELVGGWVTDHVMEVRNEPAVVVKYSARDWPTRFSQMIVTHTNRTRIAAEKALKKVLAERVALKKASQAKKEKEFLQDCPRNVKQPFPQKQWGPSIEVSGGLPSLGKKKR